MSIQPIGHAIVSRSSDVLHLLSFAADRSRSFYRILAHGQAGEQVLGSGGAEVFGYAKRLAEKLDEIGILHPEGLAELFPPEQDYLDQISSDPTTARFRPEFNTDPSGIPPEPPPPWYSGTGTMLPPPPWTSSCLVPANGVSP